ncbi:Cell cycle control protein [Phaffia rhodozyma]|uniref:Cell cycle control protein n=1 Tax=Phaffia rhodozyma TaxID=264483 RepID=A0A0F7SSS1_PHARH|nr:Cell cycle control protein [Phaffia rhodozyma]
MGLFARKRKDAAADGTEQTEVGKAKNKKPAATAFKQQRLKAWQPILTPRTVLPTLFIMGLIFAPIGGVLIWGSNKITEFTLDYTECDTQSSTLTDMPSSKFSYSLASGHSSTSISNPQWSYTNSTTGNVWERQVCTLEFDVPYDLDPSVFLYYKLTNYYQNHRRYVQSVDTDQLHGSAQSASTLNSGNCKPITSIGGLPVYPCGLIANSVFNDTFNTPTLISTSQVYNFTSNGITWSNEHKKYLDAGYKNVSQVAVPPNWVERYGSTYTEFPKLYDDPHFMVWMRTAGLPTFRKLFFRNVEETMAQGRYRIEIYMNYPVKQFNGTKSMVISTVSWIGGKNSFLGWAYVAAAALFALLGLLGTVRHLMKPRRLGDMSLLSWNQPKK